MTSGGKGGGETPTRRNLITPISPLSPLLSHDDEEDWEAHTQPQPTLLLRRRFWFHSEVHQKKKRH